MRIGSRHELMRITLRSSGQSARSDRGFFYGGGDEGEISHGGWLGSDLLSLIVSRVDHDHESHRHPAQCCTSSSALSRPTIPVDVLSFSPPRWRAHPLAALDDFRSAALALSPEQAADFDKFIRDCHNNLATATDVYHSRRFYTDACILKSVYDTSTPTLGPPAVARAIEHLDKAIIVAGAAGPGRHDLILDLIERIQSEHMSSLRPSPLPDVSLSTAAPSTPAPVVSARQQVPRFDAPPSLASFQRSIAKYPFIVPGHATDWPALNERPWHSTHYLRTVSGPGRVVPVEIGSDYRTDDWSQVLMGWDDFVTSLTQPSDEVLYLAQHSLFLQFPNMREDVVVPDYVYSCLNPPDSFPDYKPPTNDEQLVLNAWLGPKGTISPAHVASSLRTHRS